MDSIAAFLVGVNRIKKDKKNNTPRPMAEGYQFIYAINLAYCSRNECSNLPDQLSG